MFLHLIVIAWLYVVLMMSVAEATNTTGTVLGAIITFFLYGLGPVALVVYLLSTPARRRALKEKEAAEQAKAKSVATNAPDTGSEPAADPIAPVRKEP
jgi:hypothetical protein